LEFAYITFHNTTRVTSTASRKDEVTWLYIDNLLLSANTVAVFHAREKPFKSVGATSCAHADCILATKEYTTMADIKLFSQEHQEVMQAVKELNEFAKHFPDWKDKPVTYREFGMVLKKIAPICQYLEKHVRDIEMREMDREAATSSPSS